MKIEHRNTASVTPYEKNPRKNDGAVDAVARSIEEFGFRAPIIVDADGVIIAGHTRLKAAQQLGMDTVPVHVARDLSSEQVKALRIADNKTGELSEWDMDLLPIEMSELRDADFDLDAIGFDMSEIEAMLDGGESEGETDPDAVPDAPAEPVTKRGDLIVMGRHRLLCGDSTDAEDVGRLLDGANINVAVTSPPYASQRKYDESSGFKPIHPDEYVDWWDAIQANMATHLADDGSLFLNIKEHCEDGQRHLYVKELTVAHVRQWGWRFVEEYAWIHSGTPKAVVNRFKNAWEPIFHFTRGDHKFRPDAVRHETKNVPDWKGKHPSQNDGHGLRQPATNASLQGGTNKEWKHISDAVKANTDGMAYPSNVLSLGRNTDALGHGAAYPISLPSFFIEAYSDEGDTVYDPFCGSGTTVIAAEKLGRRAYTMEISPAYCDVIVRRWEEFTGEKAERPEATT